MISVSIVTYKTRVDEFKSCLDSLDSPLVTHIFVVDNYGDKDIKEICSNDKRIQYILSENVGYGTAHNKAIRKAMETDCSYHLVLNPDVTFNSDILSYITQCMEQDREIGQLQPKILYPDGELQFTVRLLPSPADVFCRRFIKQSWNRKRDNIYAVKFWNHNSPLNIPFHQGSFMFFRIDALREIGLFDERFFMYTEDIDITRRMHRRYKTLYWPDVHVTHAHRAESYKNKRLLRIHIINMIRYFNKWGWIFDKERKMLNAKVLSEIS